MRIVAARSAALIALLLVVGCTPTVRQVKVDPSRLPAVVTKARVACPYHVGEVLDARSSGERSGRLGTNVYSFPDAAQVLRRQLQDAGISQTGGARVDISILHLYIEQNTASRVPVAVYSLGIGGRSPMIVRAQPAGVNWTAGDDAAYSSFALAMQGAMDQVVQRLNEACGQTIP